MSDALPRLGRWAAIHRDRYHWLGTEQRRTLVDELARLITQGTLYAPIRATYDVSEIKEAVASAASGNRSGKILIVPRR